MSRLGRFIAITLVSISMIFSSCDDYNNLVIIDSGESSYSIVLPSGRNITSELAARELQTYLKESTGVQLPIVTKSQGEKSIILRVEGDRDSQTVSFTTEGNNIIISGSNSQYLLYATYEFVEQYTGSRFFGKDAELIPELSKVSVPKELHYSYSPKIKIRTVHSKLYYENNAFADKQRVTYESFPLYARGARVHTFHRFVPEEIYYKDHPEYYALIDGERRTTQLCLSNPEVLDIVNSEVAKIFDQDPSASVVSVSPNDNTQYCHCAECSAVDEEEGSQSGSVIRFVNSVAANFPDKQISTLAYQYTRKACKTKPADNVLITLCSIECDRSAPIEEKCGDFAADLKEWMKLTENIRIWDYTTQFTNFLAPFPNLETLQPNLKLFADNNAKWVFEQHSNNTSELFALRSYLTARLLWNPERNTDEIIKEFTDGYYGEAGRFVNRYITEIHKELKRVPEFFLFLYGGPSQAFDSYLSAENLDKYNLYFDKAEEAVKDNAPLLRRVKEARVGVRYASLEASRANLSDRYSLKNSEWVKSEFELFKQTCNEAGISLMNETKFYVADYIKMYSRNLKRMEQKSIAEGCKVVLNSKPKKYANENPQTLTDGVPGGGSFYSNWLGFEGNDMEAVIDLGATKEASHFSTMFLQVVNHVVVLPLEVSYYGSNNGEEFQLIGTVKCGKPLTKESKINDTFDFALDTKKQSLRYLKVIGRNMKTPPHWHHGTGLPSWIFADEIIVN